MIECTWNKIVHFGNIFNNLLRFEKLAKDLPSKDKDTIHHIIYSSFLDIVSAVKSYSDDKKLYRAVVPKSFKNDEYSMSWINVAPALKRGRAYISNLQNAYCDMMSEPYLSQIIHDWSNTISNSNNYHLNIDLMSKQLMKVMKRNHLKLPVGKQVNKVLIDCGFFTNQNAIKYIKYNYKHGLNMGSTLPAIKMINSLPNHIFFVTYIPNGIADVRYNGIGTSESLDDFGVPGWKVLGLNLDGLTKILISINHQDVISSQYLFNLWQKDTNCYVHLNGNLDKKRRAYYYGIR